MVLSGESTSRSSEDQCPRLIPYVSGTRQRYPDTDTRLPNTLTYTKCEHDMSRKEVSNTTTGGAGSTSKVFDQVKFEEFQKWACGSRCGFYSARELFDTIGHIVSVTQSSFSTLTK